MAKHNVYVTLPDAELHNSYLNLLESFKTFQKIIWYKC